MFLDAAISPQHDWNAVLTNRHPERELSVLYNICIELFLLSEKACTKYVICQVNVLFNNTKSLSGLLFRL